MYEYVVEFLDLGLVVFDPGEVRSTGRVRSGSRFRGLIFERRAWRALVALGGKLYLYLPKDDKGTSQH